MHIYKKRDKLVEKYEVVAFDRERLFQVRKFWNNFMGGKFFSDELATLVQKLLDGDNSVVLKILNMQMPKIYEAKLKECFKLSFVENILLEDYYRASKFFGMRLPNAPIKSEDDNFFNGYFYFKLGERMIRYGVKFDRDRLMNIRTHILASCRTMEEPGLVKMIDQLLQGKYAVTEDLLRTINNQYTCKLENGRLCDGVGCREYYRALKDVIKIEEYAVITDKEFEHAIEFFNIDCPEDYVPIASTINYERGAFAYDSRKNVVGAASTVTDNENDPDVSFILEQIKTAKDTNDDVQYNYWTGMLANIAPDLIPSDFEEATLSEDSIDIEPKGPKSL